MAAGPGRGVLAVSSRFRRIGKGSEEGIIRFELTRRR